MLCHANNVHKFMFYIFAHLHILSLRSGLVIFADLNEVHALDKVQYPFPLPIACSTERYCLCTVICSSNVLWSSLFFTFWFTWIGSLIDVLWISGFSILKRANFNVLPLCNACSMDRYGFRNVLCLSMFFDHHCFLVFHSHKLVDWGMIFLFVV